MKVNQCVKPCAWLLTHERLLRNLAIQKMGKTSSVACHTCDALVEDEIHVFRDCRAASEVWVTLHPQGRLRNVFATSLREQIQCNLEGNSSSSGENIECPEKWVLTCQSLWKWRNRRIFNNETTPLPQRLLFMFKSFEELKLACHSLVLEGKKLKWTENLRFNL